VAEPERILIDSDKLALALSMRRQVEKTNGWCYSAIGVAIGTLITQVAMYGAGLQPSLFWVLASGGSAILAVWAWVAKRRLQKEVRRLLDEAEIGRE
jgi:hypothetical protein